MALPRILILYTGGTFGMDARIRAGQSLSVPELSVQALKHRVKARVPELAELARCEVEIGLNRDSAHIGPDEWLAFARRIQSKWDRYDGFVVLHGTDTLAYTASALSFLLRPCKKPVILTGAQRPLSALRTDARRNLISAVEIAAHGPRSLVSQVSVFFDDKLLQGNRVRKRSASDFAAFDSPKAPPLAIVGTEIRYKKGAPKPLKATRMEPAFSRKVAVLHVTPGFPAKAVRERLLPDCDGLVLVVFASGTGPTNDLEFLRLLSAARESGIPVVLATEGITLTPSGSGTHPSDYAAGKKLLEAGCLWAGEMTPECAYVRTSWILGQPQGRRNFDRLWKLDFARET